MITVSNIDMFTCIYSSLSIDEKSDKNDHTLHNSQNISDFEDKVVCIPKTEYNKCL